MAKPAAARYWASERVERGGDESERNTGNVRLRTMKIYGDRVQR